MEIRECKTKAEITATHEVLTHLYDVTLDDYLKYVDEMMSTEYRLIAGFEDGECIAISGFCIGRRLYCGKYLHIHNLVVDENYRGQKFGEEMLDWLKEEAKKHQCDVMLSDTYIENHSAQNFLKKGGFSVRGYHLKQELS